MTSEIVVARDPLPSVQAVVFPPPLLETTLLALGTKNLVHGKASLYDHLLGTATLLRTWEQPERLVHAGLFHSVYSTPSYRTQAVGYEQRPMLQTLLTPEVEQLVYLFSLVTLPQLQTAVRSAPRGSGGLLTIRCGSQATTRELVLPREIVDDLLILQIANLMDQAKEPSGAPGLCLCVSSQASSLVTRGNWATTSLLLTLESGISLHDELHLHDLYELALIRVEHNPHEALRTVEQCIDLAPRLPELYVWKAALAFRHGDTATAISAAEQASDLFAVRGTTWDKRLSLDQWQGIATSLKRAGLDSEDRGHLTRIVESVSRSIPAEVIPERFYRYLARTANLRSSRSVGWYPELTSAPFHDKTQFTISAVLEDNFTAIKDEVLQLETSTFHSEAESIGRTGRWEVMILFEAGRRNRENCARLPLLAQLLASSAEVRTSAGLIYLSRIKAGTRVAAHRGGSNMRLRLQLGIIIPEGDCRLRVDEEVVGWVPGQCIVFDDFYEHEVWNNTAEDRLVLVVDLWHPDLSPAERLCLEAVSSQINSQAQGRVNYWETNRKQQDREKATRPPQ